MLIRYREYSINFDKDADKDMAEMLWRYTDKKELVWMYDRKLSIRDMRSVKCKSVEDIFNKICDEIDKMPYPIIVTY